MEIQDYINAKMIELREERLSNSQQLLLGELILKLENIKDKTKPIIFDFGMKPAGASSWRGSYCELGLKYSENGGGEARWQSDRIYKKLDDGDVLYESDSFKLPENPTAQNFLDMLNALKDKTMTGYKGGDFKMHENVAVYFGNYGDYNVYNYKGKEYATVIPVDILEDEMVIIVTEEQDY